LWLYQRTMFGPVTHDVNKTLPDMNLREHAVLLPLVVMAFWIGIYPQPFFGVIEKPVERIVRQVNPGFYLLVPAQSADTRAISAPAEVK
jgi:NADH-quinone oxidoreductase subunit M